MSSGRKRKRADEPQAPAKKSRIDGIVVVDQTQFYEDIAIVLNHGDQPATLLGSMARVLFNVRTGSVYGEKPKLDWMATDHKKSEPTEERILETRQRSHRNYITEENGYEVRNDPAKGWTTPFQIYKELTKNQQDYPRQCKTIADAQNLYNAIQWFLFNPTIEVTATVDENENTTLTVDEGYPKDALKSERFVMFTKPNGTFQSFEICSDRTRKFIKTRIDPNRYRVKVQPSQKQKNNINENLVGTKVEKLLNRCLKCNFKHFLFIKRKENAVGDEFKFRESYDNERICGITLFYFSGKDSYTSVIALPNRESAQYVISEHEFIYGGQTCAVKFSTSSLQDCSQFLG